MTDPRPMAAAEELVVRADPRTRRLVLQLLLGMTALGALTIGWFVPWLIRSLEEAVVTGRIANRAVCVGFLAVLAANAVAVAAFGVMNVKMGSRVVAAGRFPLPGARVFRDTRVLTGRAALLAGRGYRVLGALLVLLATALLALSVYALSLLV